MGIINMLSMKRFVYFLLLLQQVLSRPSQNVLGKREELKLIDINRYIEIKDYDAVAKAYDGVLISIGDFSEPTKPSQYLVNHYNKFLGKTNIGYFFNVSNTTTVEQLENDIGNVHTIIKDNQNNFPLYMALRNGATGNWLAENKESNTKIALAGVKKMKELGYVPGLFTNDNPAKVAFNMKEIKNAGTSIWIARWGLDDGTLNEKYKPEGFADYDIWEYTSKGFDANISTNDVNEVPLNALVNKNIIIKSDKKQPMVENSTMKKEIEKDLNKTDAKKDNEDSNNWVYALIGVGVILLIGLGVGIMYTVKNKKKDEKNNNDDDEEPPSYEQVVQEQTLENTQLPETEQSNNNEAEENNNQLRTRSSIEKI